MKTFLLVHGAWQGASTWDFVADRLRRAGHRVLTPSLTGLGDRRHQLSPQTNLSDHIEDVVGVLEFEGLADATLVGHSYAGMIISGVAERTPTRIQELVYIDAFTPVDGQSAMQLLPEKSRQTIRDQARTLGDGWRLPGLEKRLELWGLKPGPHWDFVRTKLCDFTIRCFEEPVKMPTHKAASLPRTYIACVAQDYPGRQIFEPMSEAARTSSDWRYAELSTGHDCHVEMPEALTELLTRSRTG